jgi:hypothetical protein
MPFSVCDASVLGLSLTTMAGVIYLVKPAFKKHHVNVFGHLMVILIVFGLLSKPVLPNLASACLLLHD